MIIHIQGSQNVFINEQSGFRPLRPEERHQIEQFLQHLGLFCILVAKNARPQAALIEQMKRHEIVKRYLALVEGYCLA